MSASVFVPVGKGRAFEWACDSLEAAKEKIKSFPARTQAKAVLAFEGAIVQRYNCMTAEIEEHAAELHACPICAKVCKTAGGLSSHMRTHVKPDNFAKQSLAELILGQNGKPGKCDLCGYQSILYEVEDAHICVDCAETA